MVCQIKRGTLDTLSVSSKNDNSLKSPARSYTQPVDKTPLPSLCKSVLLNKVEIQRNRRPATNQPGPQNEPSSPQSDLEGRGHFSRENPHHTPRIRALCGRPTGLKNP